ncbi:hypothetical protein QYF61_018113 [Mycteria americana]|uniref:Rho-GAP domain-containing protein n=1 Tax=Mycteria americana TaxID=33587 RepID=A0AAN7P0J2_MYCAM|nr:hypothetical protein QYF61_018113 [Mycteria americana]
MTGLGDEETAEAVLHLDVSKAFTIVCKNSLMEKLKKHGLAEKKRSRTENWWSGWAQRLVTSGTTEALGDAEPVLSADVRLSRGRKRSERRLLLLREELVVAKSQRGTTLRPRLRLALDQLWVLSGGKEAAGEEEEEQEEGTDDNGTSLIFVWPTGSCIATFGSRALKELWVGTLLGTPEGAQRARVIRLPSLKLLEKELSRRHAWRTFSSRSLERLMEGQAEADAKQGPPTVPSSNGGGLCHSPAGESSRRRRRGLPWPFALRRSPAAAQAPGQAGSGCSRALFGQPLAALCGEDGTLPQPIQELLAVLQQEGPSTEGIFRRAASATAFRELREALDRGADVDLGSQPALLLAVILKDFLRSIPSKLLVTDLYEDWMAAMQKPSKEEKISELKAVAEKLPVANLLLLKRLLSLLQHIGHNAATSRMTPSNLAICVGPNLLSPPNEDLLPLEAMLQVTDKVKVLVEFLLENCRQLFAEETSDLSSPPAEESPAPTETCRGERRDCGLSQAGARDARNLSVAPPALPPATPERAADSLGRPEELASLAEDRREALGDAEPVLSADVRLSRGRKRSERRLLLLREELVVAKSQRGTTLHPRLRLALDQLWVLSGGKEAAGEEEEEQEEGTDDNGTSLIFVWPTGSCIATFGSRALKELWVGTLLGTPEGAQRARVTRLPSLKLLEKELSRRHAWRTFSSRSLERLMEGQAEADAKQGPPTVPSSNGGGLCHSPAGESSRRRRRGLPWPFALRRSPAAAQAPGQAGSGCSRALFGQPLAALCGEDGTLPQPIQELLAVLQQEGPSTEGIFRRAASATAFRELREALDRGADVDLGSQPALLLAVILKDFLRSIPSKLLVTDLYEDWMAAMQKPSKEEKISELKAVAEKLPVANLLLLKRLLSLLQHIGHNAATSRMTPSNLAICVGPNLLSPPNEDLLPLEAMLQVTDKVKVLVEFLLENCRQLFAEETSDLSSPPAEESPAPTETCRGERRDCGLSQAGARDARNLSVVSGGAGHHVPLEEPSVPAFRADTEHGAGASPHAPPAVLGVLQEAGGDMVVQAETGEAPPALPPATPERAADSLGRPEELASLAEDRREALGDAEPVLSADVRLSRGRKRSERRLLLLREELVVAKSQRGTTLHPRLRLALDQLWVLSGGKEAAGEEEEEQEEGTDDNGTSLIFVWPTGSCIATFGSRALKELWVGTLLGTPEGAQRARVTRLPSLKLLEKELSRRHAWRTFSSRSLERLMEGQAEADAKQGPPTVPSSNGGGLCHSPAGESSRRRRRGLPWPFALRRSPAAAQAPGQAGSGCSRALFGQPLAALCGEDGTLPQPIQELLAVLQQEGPSTEGIFRRAASATAFRELREALDRGADVDLGSQPALLLAIILKDFLRSIPSKLLVTDLYEDWMAAMQKPSKEEKISELKAVAEKLPVANLLLLKRLLSLLQHIGHNAATSRMTPSNLAICVGPNLLSPPNEDLLPLEAMLQVTDKVKVLVEFLLENCRQLFAEETSDLSSPPAEESPAPTETCRGERRDCGLSQAGARDARNLSVVSGGAGHHVPLEEPSVPAFRADTEHGAGASPHAPPAVLGVLQEAGGDMVVQAETGEAPPALPPATPERAADSLGRPEELASLAEDRREALGDAEPVLSADVRLSRGRKRSERRLLLLREELVVAKSQRGTTLRPRLRLALDQLWVLSGGKEAAGEEEEEQEEGTDDNGTSLIFVWPTGSCIATFGSRALKELWVGTLLGTPEGAQRARVTRLPSLKLLEKELSRRHAWRTFSSRSLERLMEGQAEADAKQGPPTVPSSNGGGLCHSPAGESSRRRRRGLPWPFALRRSPAAAQAPGQAGSGCSRALFGQPLAALCGEDGMLPQPIQELLAVLQQEGPSTEGIFRRAASATAFRELREALDRGADVDLGSQPALLLAVILKDFLRSIPSKLLVTDLYEDWMAAMQKPSKEEKISELKAVAEKLPVANLLLLKRLLSLLQHIGHNAATSRMTPSNLAICVGPNLLSPPNEDLLPLEAMLQVTDKVKVLVEFLLENCRQLFAEETSDLSSPPAEESPAPTETCRGERRDCGLSQAGARDARNLSVAPPALPPATPERAADSLGRPEELASLAEDRREALGDAEPVLSADVRLSRGRKRSERRLLLLREELVVAKSQRGTTLRPRLRLALDQLWVLSGGKEAAGEEEEEQEEGTDDNGTSLIFVWPTGSCIATFGSRALKELWVGTLLGTPEGAQRARVTRLPSLKLLEKELSRRHAWRTFSTRSLERLMEGQAEADAKQGPPTVPSSNGGGLCHSPAGESSRRRRRGLPWPFALRRSPAAAQAPGQAGSGCSRALFGQPLAALCGEDGTLPQPIQELLAVLQQEGPSTEGIFRRAASATAFRELREALDRGADVDLGSQPALLLAVILKDFLRSIPSKLLVTDLYEDWMAAMQKPSKEEKISELKAVAEKLPVANLLLLKRLLSLLQHIGHNAATSRMTPSNLAICVGPNLLSPPNEDLLPLEAMLQVTDKVKVLVEFLLENCRQLFAEETSDLSSPPAEESPAPTETCRGERRDCGLSQAGARDARNLSVVSGGAGHRALSSRPRLWRGLSLAPASRA